MFLLILTKDEFAHLRSLEYSKTQIQNFNLEPQYKTPIYNLDFKPKKKNPNLKALKS
jgi:hypothetical protein